MLAVLFLLSLPAVTARLYSSDEVQYFSYLRSLWFDRDVSFENEYRYFYDHNIAQSGGYYETFLVRETGAGRRVNYGTIGCALLWSPFYGVADLWTRATGGVADGFSPPYIRAVAYGSAFYGILAVLLSIRAATLFFWTASVWELAAGSWTPASCRRRRLVWHSAALLHVRRAAVLACGVGVRRGAVRDGVAARAAASGASSGTFVAGQSARPCSR